MHARYGLIGYPLGHSFSPAYFTEKFAREKTDATYEAFPLPDISGFPALLAAHPDLQGLNVTIPHKTTVIPYLDALTEAARAIGAVNCIRIRDGHCTGYNTDVIGFRRSLEPLLQPQHRQALVLGNGGAAKAVIYALQELSIGFRQVSRRAGQDVLTYEQLSPELVAAHPLIINTTPLGMQPHTEEYPPLPYEALGKNHLLYDLVYNPAETVFLTKGKQQGAITKNGLEMLHLQAEAAWKIWQDA